MSNAVITVVLLGSTASLSFAQAPPSRARGLGVLGGLAGAGIGAAIGEDGGDAVPGALIGGAIGALGGTVLGGTIDQEEARQNAYLYAQQQQMAQLVTPGDVVAMAQAGLGDDVIITQIRTRGLSHRLTTNDCILLKQQGVSDRVINAMQQLPYGVRTVEPAPVVVHEYHYPRYYWAPAPRYHYYHHYRHRPHSSFHLHLGH